MLRLVPASPCSETGDPTGIRTPVATVKGWCPRPLDEGDLKLSALPEPRATVADGCPKVLVEVSGIEPLTSCMPCKRSPKLSYRPKSNDGNT